MCSPDKFCALCTAKPEPRDSLYRIRVTWFGVSLNDSHLEGIYEVEGSADATIVDETIAGEGNTLVRFAFVDIYQFYFAVLGCDNDQFGKDLRHCYRTDGGVVLYFTLKCYILRLQSVVP